VPIDVSPSLVWVCGSELNLQWGYLGTFQPKPRMAVGYCGVRYCGVAEQHSVGSVCAGQMVPPAGFESTGAGRGEMRCDL
jgi:hypothetical protein